MSTYLDLNYKFGMDPLVDNQCTVADIKNVRDSLERLLMTSKGEVPFNRSYGTTLKYLLFKAGLDASDITNFLYMDITTWEPRVVLNAADISVEKIDIHSYKVTCTFTVIGVNGNPQTLSTIISN